MIVVVEDDPEFRREITSFLSARGLAALAVSNGDGLARVLAERPVSLVLLDVMLQASGENGLDIARRLRQDQPDVPVVMLTCLDQAEDHVRGLDSGAEAYLAKGGDLLVLEATLRNVLKRREARTGRASWTLDLTAWQLRAADGRGARLTHLERLFLHALLSTGGAAASRADLLEALGKSDTIYEQRNLDNVIRRLRRKVETEIGQPLPVHSAYGQGYAFGAVAVVTGKL